MEKQPYEMTREEWNRAREETKITHGQKKFTKNSKSEEIHRMQRLEFILYGIGEWIYKRACNGDLNAIEMLNYPTYDRYDAIIEKAKEEGKI